MNEYQQKLQLLRIMQAYGKIEVALADYSVLDLTSMLYDGLAYGNWPRGFIAYTGTRRKP